MSRNDVLLPKAPGGFRLVEQSLDTWIDDRIAAAEAVAHAAGYAEAMAGAAGAFEEAARRLDADREEAVEALSAFATRFACEISRHLLRQNIKDQGHDINAMVRATLAEAGVGRGKCVVHVNPSDAETLKDAPFRSGTTIEADGSIPPGSVQVSTPRGLLVRDVDDCIRHAADRIYSDLRGASQGREKDSPPEGEPDRREDA